MAVYKIHATFKTDLKQPRRGYRETLRSRLLKALGAACSEDVNMTPGESLRTLRSVRVERVR